MAKDVRWIEEVAGRHGSADPHGPYSRSGGPLRLRPADSCTRLVGNRCAEPSPLYCPSGSALRTFRLRRDAAGLSRGDLLYVVPGAVPEGGEFVIDLQFRVGRHGGGPVFGVIVGVLRANPTLLMTPRVLAGPARPSLRRSAS